MSDFNLQSFGRKNYDKLNIRRKELLLAKKLILHLTEQTKQAGYPEFVKIELEEDLRCCDEQMKEIESQIAIPYINFIDKDVFLGTSEHAERLSSNNQPMLLLQSLISKPRIHWIEGIRVFKEWRTIRPDITNLKDKFQGVISKLRGEKGFLRPNGIFLDIESDRGGFSRLIERDSVHSNILQAEQLFKQALLLYQSASYEEVNQILSETLSIYPEHMPTALFFVDVLNKTDPNGIDLKAIRRLFKKEMAILEKAIETSKHYSDEMKKATWQKKMG